MNDVTSFGGAQGVFDRSSLTRVLKPRMGWLGLALVLTLTSIASAVVSTSTAEAAALTAPLLVGPINRSSTTLSVRFYRVPESGGSCQTDIGYEFRGGIYIDWHDAGGFPNAPCSDPDPGYKFSGLIPDTSYQLSVRAYRLVDGVKTDYSSQTSITATTLPSTTPTPAVAVESAAPASIVERESTPQPEASASEPPEPETTQTAEPPAVKPPEQAEDSPSEPEVPSTEPIAATPPEQAEDSSGENVAEDSQADSPASSDAGVEAAAEES